MLVCTCASRISTTTTSAICSSQPTLRSTLSSTACFDDSSAVVSTPAAAPRYSPSNTQRPPPANATPCALHTLTPPILLPATPTDFRPRRREERCADAIKGLRSACGDFGIGGRSTQQHTMNRSVFNAELDADLQFS